MFGIRTIRHGAFGLGLALSAVWAASTMTWAQDNAFVEHALEGFALHGGANLVDPPPGAARDTHMHFVVTGAAALAMFESMPGAAAEDACTGGQMKRAATGLVCLRYGPSEGECFFAIDLPSGAITTAGIVC